MSVHEIASAEHLSTNTIKTQVRAVYRKLGVAGRDEALRVAVGAPDLLA
jgi:LuxR family maltose regulon positive regulatory protein